MKEWSWMMLSPPPARGIGVFTRSGEIRFRRGWQTGFMISITVLARCFDFYCSAGRPRMQPVTDAGRSQGSSVPHPSPGAADFKRAQ
jgi:hypothetical protein